MPSDRRHEPGPASPAIMKPILTWRACDACITHNLEAECRHKQRVLSPDTPSEDEDESSSSGVASPIPPPPGTARWQQNQRNQRDTKPSAEKPAARMRKHQEEEESGDGSEPGGRGEGNDGGKARKIGRKRLYDEDDEEDEGEEDEEESRVAMRKRTNKARSTITLDSPDLEDEEGETHDTIEGKGQRRPRVPTARSKTGGESHLAKTPIKPPPRAPAPLSNSSVKWRRQSQRETFVDSVPKSRTTVSTKQKMRARLPISPIFLDALANKTLYSSRCERQTVVPQAKKRSGGVPRAVRISITPPLPDNAELSPEPVLGTLQEQEMESRPEPETENGPNVGLGLGLRRKPSESKGKQREQPVPSSTIPSSPSDPGMQSPVMEDGHADKHTPKAVEDSPGARSDDDLSPLRSASPPPPSVPAAPSPIAHPSAAPSQKLDRSVLENLRNPYPHLDPYAALPPGHQAAIKRWKDPERAQFNRWSGPMYAPCAYSIIRPECSFLLVPKRLRDEWEAKPQQNLGGTENQQQKENE